MMWLTFLLLLAGSGAGTRTNKVEVSASCTDPLPENFTFIVLKGVDKPYQLTKKVNRFGQKLPVFERELPDVVVFAGTRAVLHLRGRRVGCQKPVMTSDDVAVYTFVCGEKSRDLVIVPAPKDVSAHYQRRVKGEAPDCTVRGSLSGETTVQDFIPDEDVVLQFGSAKANSPGLSVANIRWPKEPAGPGRSPKPAFRTPETKFEALTVEARTLDKIHIQAESTRQYAEATGYLSSIYIDVSGMALERFTSLHFQVKDPSP
jgi:hypothetical protein